MQHHLQQEIPEFILKVGIGAMADRVGHFMGFLEDVGHQRAVCLLQIPGAAVLWITQLGYHLHEVLQRVGGAGGHGASASERSYLLTAFDVGSIPPARDLRPEADAATRWPPDRAAGLLSGLDGSEWLSPARRAMRWGSGPG